MGVMVKHYLTYQHNVQRYFRDHDEKYDGVIVPLSIATAFPSGTYGFVRALCSRDCNKQYAIDPRSPLFQKSWDRDSVRDPHRRMAEVFGEPFISKGLNLRLDSSDFDAKSTIESVTEGCLSYQLKFKTSEQDLRKLEKYKKLLGITQLGRLGDPQFLIPPYFQFDRQDDAWYRVCMRFVAAASEFKTDVPIAPVLHFQNWAAVQEPDGMFSELKRLKMSGCWLYPNDFHEHDALEDELAKYRAVVEQAKSLRFEVSALFGGYFAMLMGHFGLQGFANGVGYGEWRDSAYHRGGTAATRIYILRLHRFLDAPLAQTLLDRDPDYFGKDTDLLSACVEAERPLIAVTLAETLDHFMQCRELELDMIKTRSVEDALDEMRETIKHLSSVGPEESKKYGASLQRWCNVVEG